MIGNKTITQDTQEAPSRQIKFKTQVQKTMYINSMIKRENKVTVIANTHVGFGFKTK